MERTGSSGHRSVRVDLASRRPDPEYPGSHLAVDLASVRQRSGLVSLASSLSPVQTFESLPRHRSRVPSYPSSSPFQNQARRGLLLYRPIPNPPVEVVKEKRLSFPSRHSSVLELETSPVWVTLSLFGIVANQEAVSRWHSSKALPRSDA